MTLMLPVLDYARSLRPLVNRVAQHVPPDACIAASRLPRSVWASLEYFGRYRVDGLLGEADTRCTYLLQPELKSGKHPAPPGWALVARVTRPTDRTEWVAIYKRTASRASQPLAR